MKTVQLKAKIREIIIEDESGSDIVRIAIRQ
jgi:hypothetical protein